MPFSADLLPKCLALVILQAFPLRPVVTRLEWRKPGAPARSFL